MVICLTSHIVVARAGGSNLCLCSVLLPSLEKFEFWNGKVSFGMGTDTELLRNFV